MAEVTSQRNLELFKKIEEVASDLASLIRWPESEATKMTADNAIKELRKQFKESAYPHAVTYMAMTHIAQVAYGDVVGNRGPEIKMQAIKTAWIKIGDLLC
jgi:hypothetical protein